MASTTYITNIFRKYITDGTIDLDTNTIKVALVTSGYTWDAAHTVWGDVSASEVATGAGYTTGGQALTTKALTVAAAVTKWTADNPIWTALTKTFSYAAIYASGTLNGVIDPLIGVILLDNTPASVVVSAADYSIQWNAAGILTLS